jgi:hypothetical protein
MLISNPLTKLLNEFTTKKRSSLFENSRVQSKLQLLHQSPVNLQSLAGVNYLACSTSLGYSWESLREGPYRLLGTVGAPSLIQILSVSF